MGKFSCLCKFLLVTILCIVSLFNCGCSIFSSKGSSSDIIQSGIIFKVKVEMPSALSSNLKASILPAITSGNLLTSAEVELYLKGYDNPYKLVESTTEAGVYSALIPIEPNYASMSALVIAKKNKLVFMNIISNVASASIQQDTYNKFIDVVLNVKTTTTCLIISSLISKFNNELKIESIAELPKILSAIDNSQNAIILNNNEKLYIDNISKELEKGSFNSVINKVIEVVNAVNSSQSAYENYNSIIEIPDVKNQVATVIQSPTITDLIIPSNALLEENSKLFLAAIIKILRGEAINSEQLNQLENILSDDFVYVGRSKRDFLALVSSNQISLGKDILQDHDLKLVFSKLSDDVYKLHVSGPVTFRDKKSNKAYKLIVDSRQNGLDFDNSFSNYYSNTLKPFVYFPVLVKKISDTWKIVGNGLRIEEIVISEIEVKTNSRGSEDDTSAKSNFAIKLSSTFPLKEQYGYAWCYKNNDIDMKMPLHKINEDLSDQNVISGWLFENISSIANGDTYTLDLTFADSKNQKIALKLLNLDNKFFEKPSLVTTLENGRLVIDWAKCLYSDFTSYDVLVYANRISSDPQNPDKIKLLEETIYNVTPTYKIVVLPQGSTINSNDLFAVNVEIVFNRLTGLKRVISKTYWYDEIPVYNDKLPTQDERNSYGSEATLEFRR